MKILYLDVETTGLHPVKNDIIQIGGIIEIDKQIQTTFNLKCRPINWENISKEAEAVHGISKRKLKSYPHSSIAYTTMMNILMKYENGEKFIFAGQAVNFDKAFLKAFFEKHGNYNFKNHFITDKVIDLKKIAKKIVKLSNYKLITMAGFCDLIYNPHDAYSDIITTRLLIKHFQKIKKLRKKGLPYEYKIKKQGVEKC